jgi:hypothetical protein
MNRPTSYRVGQGVRHAATGRVGSLIRRNRPYAQWLVRLSDGSYTWWWEADFTKIDP